MKSERKPIKARSTYSPTGFSQLTKKSSSCRAYSVPSLQDMDVAKYSEKGFKCYFWDVQQWVTQSGNRNSS